MKLKKMHWLGIIFGIIILLLDVIFFREEKMFFFLLGIAAVIVVSPFMIGLFLENRREKDLNERFLEFSRNLAESVTTGTPISKSIINLRYKNYGSLSPYIVKLSNQISLGIPVNIALNNFAYDVNSQVIKRAVSLIREAERAGGEIDYILGSVAKSISEIEKLKKERQAAIYNLVVEGYIIFMIFIGIMLVMEFKILPMTAGLTSIQSFSELGLASSGSTLTPEDLSRPFLYLLLAQGFFAGLTIGKLAEGSIKAGLRHSFILTVLAFLISSGARIFLG